MPFNRTNNTIDPNIDLEQARLESLDLINQKAFISAGAAIVPIPFIDLVVDLGVLAVLLPQINAKFGLSEKHMRIYDPATKTVHWQELFKRGIELSGYVSARAAMKQTLTGYMQRYLTKQVSKFVPLGGTIAAASLGFILMKKIAETHVEDCYQTALRIRAEQNKRQAQAANQQTSI